MLPNLVTDSIEKYYRFQRLHGPGIMCIVKTIAPFFTSIALKLLVQPAFTGLLLIKSYYYTNSLVNATFGSGKKSCYPKIVLSKLRLT